MARVDRQAAFRAWRSYDAAPLGTRAFVAARFLVLPLCEIDAELRALRGRVMSLGAGYGTVERYVVQVNPGITIEGLDLNADRVALSEAHPAPRVSLQVADVLEPREAGSYDSALSVDVLHHIPADRHADLFAAVHHALRPGGVWLLKDIARTPRWQHGWNWVHDRIVAGPEKIHCREPEEVVDFALRAGFASARSRRVGRFDPYPHYLVELRAAS